MECGFDEAEGGGASQSVRLVPCAALLTRAGNGGVRADRPAWRDGARTMRDTARRRRKVNEGECWRPSRNLGSRAGVRRHDPFLSKAHSASYQSLAVGDVAADCGRYGTRMRQPALGR